MVKYIFMTEERSMEEALLNILPKIDIFFKNKENFQIIPHEGKQDLEKSIPRKIRAWRDTSYIQYKFIIIRDNDNSDCLNVKNKLNQLCVDNDRNNVLIRIAMQELESWFLGDLNAVDQAFKTKMSSKQNTRKFRNPDSINNPSQVLSKLLNNKSKISWSKNISNYMNINNNKSTSFNVFKSGVLNLL